MQLYDFLKAVEHGEYSDHIHNNDVIIVKQLSSTTSFPEFGKANQGIVNFIASGSITKMCVSERVSQYCEYPVIMVDRYIGNIFVYIDGTTMYPEEPKFYWTKEN